MEHCVRNNTKSISIYHQRLSIEVHVKVCKCSKNIFIIATIESSPVQFIDGKNLQCYAKCKMLKGKKKNEEVKTISITKFI